MRERELLKISACRSMPVLMDEEVRLVTCKLTGWASEKGEVLEGRGGFNLLGVMSDIWLVER